MTAWATDALRRNLRVDTKPVVDNGHVCDKIEPRHEPQVSTLAMLDFHKSGSIA